MAYHCFRGLLTPETEIYLTSSSSARPSSASHQPNSNGEPVSAAHLPKAGPTSTPETCVPGAAACRCDDTATAQTSASAQQWQRSSLPSSFKLVNARSRAAAAQTSAMLDVYTRDGEWFPVRRKLLRPCINLTKIVRSHGEQAGSLTVDVDTDIFDRCCVRHNEVLPGRQFCCKRLSAGHCHTHCTGCNNLC